MKELELSSEDSLRLNVLLAQKPRAIRIDESRMTLYALTEKGEASVMLNPDCRDDQYLRRVRELLSMHALGSPGGYPVYITRWTRMGQERGNDTLLKLLLLGEPEAVVAVAHAPGLTPELAELAWWAMPDAENARRMLFQPQVAQSELAYELAQFLIEYLPFETEPKAIMDSVRLVLQPGLLSDEQTINLWNRASRKGTFYVSFLQAMPEDLPEQCPAHPEQSAIKSALDDLLAENNPFAEVLCKCLSSKGQAFLKTAEAAMDKLADEATSVALFETIGRYFSGARPQGASCGDSDAALAHAEVCTSDPEVAAPGLAEVLEIIPEQKKYLRAILTLSFAGEELLDSFFSHSDTVGPLMRRKMTPWTEPMLEQIRCLRS
ncbi:MAG: sulfur reduction protein DsrS [Gammaproteobacteria bacterium]|nr:sulfur reduction protein DsrS [Gammaproteobacteria bacterium]